MSSPARLPDGWEERERRLREALAEIERVTLADLPNGADEPLARCGEIAAAALDAVSSGPSIENGIEKVRPVAVISNAWEEERSSLRERLTSDEAERALARGLQADSRGLPPWLIRAGLFAVADRLEERGGEGA